MKMCFLNSCFLEKFKSLFAVIVLCLFLFTSCKCKRGCEGLDSKTEQLISDGIKSSILGFPADTNWAFKCVTATSSHKDEKDTLFLEAQEIYPLEKGDCALMDKGKCCSDYYNEKSNRKLNAQSTSGLNNFTAYYTDENGLSVKGDWGNILILDHMYSQDFLTRFNESLTLADTVLTDTRLAESDEKGRNDSTPFLVSWSRKYGLVMYAYKIGSDTVKYERVDIK